MKYEPVAKTRSKIQDDPNGLQIVIPSRINWLIAIFMTAWLVGWAIGEGSAIRGIIFRAEGEPISLFLVVWLTGWTVGGGVALISLLWMFLGEERILLRHDALVIEHYLGGLGRKRAYDATKVMRLRVASSESMGKGNKPSWNAFGYNGTGIVAFDYGAKTIRFGMSIDESEGRMLIGKLKERCPFSDQTPRLDLS